MKISIRIDSAAAQAQLRRWGGELRAKVQKAVARALAVEAIEIKQEVRAHVGAQIAALHLEEAYVNTLDPQVMA